MVIDFIYLFFFIIITIMAEEHVEKSKSRLRGQTSRVQGRKMLLPEIQKKYNIYITQPRIVYSKTRCLVYKDLVFKSLKTVVYYSVW